MRRYLIVDDNVDLAENLAEIISSPDAEAEAVGTIDQALERVRHERFDAVLTDMRMPLATGAELVRALRRIDPALPACVMTAYTTDDDLATARREGLLAIFGKPVPIGQMLQTLRSARRDGLAALVEDDPAFSDNLIEVLRDHGFGVVVAASVAEAEALEVARPFAALVDLRVPGGPDGEAARRFAARFPDVPRVVITALTAPGALPGAVAVFSKPFDPGELLRTLDRLHAHERSP